MSIMPVKTKTNSCWNYRQKRLAAAQLIKWHSRGYIFGPIPEKWVIKNKGVINHFFSVPKGQDAVRPILNLSDNHDLGYSINDLLEDSLCTVEYIQQLEIIEMIKVMGRGSFLWAKDLEWGYNNLPIHPEDVPNLCFRFDGKIYGYQVLPMGLSSACNLFTEFMHFPLWAIKQSKKPLFYVTVPKQSVKVDNFIDTADITAKGSNYVIALITHYLDDILGGHRSLFLAKQQCKQVDTVLNMLGLRAQPSKNKNPAQVQDWLGKEYDTVKWRVRLPDRKAVKYVGNMELLMAKPKATKLEFLKCVGQVRHGGTIFRPLNAFARGLERWAYTVEELHEKINITEPVKRDLRFACWALKLANKIGADIDSFRHTIKEPIKVDATIYTDASVTIGVGGIISTGYYYQVHWTEVKQFLTKQRDILWRELVGVFMAIDCWKEHLRGKWVHVYTDNEPVKWFLIKMRARLARHDLQIIINEICRILLLYRIEMWIDHIPGKKNITADALSRYFKDPLSQAPFHIQSKTCAIHSAQRASDLSNTTSVNRKHLNFKDDDI